MGISHGRGTRRWKYVIRPSVLAESDVCIWCGHAGAMTVDHIIPIAVAPELAEVRSNLGAIHGQEGCPVCPPRYSRRTKSMQPRRCNLEKGKRLTGPPANGSRPW